MESIILTKKSDFFPLFLFNKFCHLTVIPQIWTGGQTGVQRLLSADEVALGLYY